MGSPSGEGSTDEPRPGWNHEPRKRACRSRELENTKRLGGATNRFASASTQTWHFGGYNKVQLELRFLLTENSWKPNSRNAEWAPPDLRGFGFMSSATCCGQARLLGAL
jgi:hypothetical protein